MDASSVPAKRGDEVGPSRPIAASRARSATSWSTATAWPSVVLTRASVHDSRGLIPAVDALAPVRPRRGRPRKRPDKLHADKASDFNRRRQDLRRRSITPASPGAAWTAPRPWAATSGWWNAPSPGSTSSAACASATSATPAYTKPSWSSPPPTPNCSAAWRADTPSPPLQAPAPEDRGCTPEPSAPPSLRHDEIIVWRRRGSPSELE